MSEFHCKTRQEREAAAFLSLLMLEEARKRGSNPPFWLWAADLAPKVGAPVAMDAAFLAKMIYDMGRAEHVGTEMGGK